MPAKTNAKSVNSILEENLKSDSTILKEFAKVVGFAALASSGEPMTMALGIAKVSEAAGSAITACLEVLRRLSSTDVTAPSASMHSYDRFKALFYTACARAYIQAIPGALDELVKLPPSASSTASTISTERVTLSSEKDKASMAARLQTGIANLADAEVSYLYSIAPLTGDVELFQAYTAWLGTALERYGFERSNIARSISKCTDDARIRFRAFISSPDTTAEWMRRYLAIEREEKLISLMSDLRSVQDTLSPWMAPVAELKRQEIAAWQAYRDMLATLPDLRDTMFNEQFGVRRVFLQPQAKYHVAGAVGDAGKPQAIADLGNLLGALISTRTTGEDLIVLCGGPGSGKSTLCKILASQLASDANMHPVFLRLRRLKEGADVAVFLEESLQRQGVITRLADLRSLPNLVLILDGFDELVMASRSRLRQFFNVLREEHSSLPLRTAKIIVSGRDTLFPQGDGLPSGSHVISLLPFDGERVKAWGEKWRCLHKDGPGATFEPERFVDNSKDRKKAAALHHLVTWPLTLHLVARVHTSGRLDLGIKGPNPKLEKAYLYRSILAETASRQVTQADSQGRLNPQNTREFLRDLAWRMYSESRDSMDPVEVMPLLARYFPESNESELSELADVAVVNSPELSKGEETGFEFVHKSFAEYLVAERMAHSVELTIFKAAQFGTDELTWRMSDLEAARELAPTLATRLLPEEVQEMLEPMLGALHQFLQGARVSETVTAAQRSAGLANIIDRFEELHKNVLLGAAFDTVAESSRRRLLITSPLDAYANYSAGILLIGAAAARQSASLDEDTSQLKRPRRFRVNLIDGGFWKSLSILHAGGLHLDRRLCARLFKGLEAYSSDGKGISDTAVPFKLSRLRQIRGFEPRAGRAIEDMLLENALLNLLIEMLLRKKRPQDEVRMGWHFWGDHDRYFSGAIDVLDTAGLIEDPATIVGFLRAAIAPSQVDEQVLARLSTRVLREIAPRIGPRPFPTGARRVVGLIQRASEAGLIDSGDKELLAALRHTFARFRH